MKEGRRRQGASRLDSRIYVRTKTPVIQGSSAADLQPSPLREPLPSQRFSLVYCLSEFYSTGCPIYQLIALDCQVDTY